MRERWINSPATFLFLLTYFFYVISCVFLYHDHVFSGYGNFLISLWNFLNKSLQKADYTFPFTLKYNRIQKCFVKNETSRSVEQLQRQNNTFILPGQVKMISGLRPWKRCNFPFKVLSHYIGTWSNNTRTLHIGSHFVFTFIGYGLSGC